MVGLRSEEASFAGAPAPAPAPEVSVGEVLVARGEDTETMPEG
jgi:hypothetical protein